MLTPSTLPALQSLLAQERLDGWLLFDFRGRNPVASALLGKGIVGTRRVYVLLPSSGVPIALVHAIDQELWRDWPPSWKKVIWVRRHELADLLVVLAKNRRLAVDFSPRGASPYLDCVPSGVIDLLKEIGCELVPSEELVTRFLSVWSEADCGSHEKAAAIVAAVARYAIGRVGGALKGGTPVTEFDVSQWILHAFEREGLETESGPSVCFGPNAARNHYEPTRETAAAILPGQLLLMDLWAKEPGGVYADQTWMASIGLPSDRDQRLWDVVREARDHALALLRERFEKAQPVTGADIDLAAYQTIASAGYERAIASRTGHSIDRFGLHGFGPPIDGTETLDRRLLIPGVGFSIEPGIYLEGETGVRSEVNVYLRKNDVVVTPREYQRDLIIV